MVVVSGIHQSTINLFNLLLAIQFGSDNNQFSDEDIKFFLDHFVELKDYDKWRDSATEFVGKDEKMNDKTYAKLKKRLEAMSDGY